MTPEELAALSDAEIVTLEGQLAAEANRRLEEAAAAAEAARIAAALAAGAEISAQIAAWNLAEAEQLERGFALWQTCRAYHLDIPRLGWTANGGGLGPTDESDKGFEAAYARAVELVRADLDRSITTVGNPDPDMTIVVS